MYEIIFARICFNANPLSIHTPISYEVEQCIHILSNTYHILCRLQIQMIPKIIIYIYRYYKQQHCTHNQAIFQTYILYNKGIVSLAAISNEIQFAAFFCVFCCHCGLCLLSTNYLFRFENQTESNLFIMPHFNAEKNRSKLI